MGECVGKSAELVVGFRVLGWKPSHLSKPLSLPQIVDVLCTTADISVKLKWYSVGGNVQSAIQRKCGWEAKACIAICWKTSWDLWVEVKVLRFSQQSETNRQFQSKCKLWLRDLAVLWAHGLSSPCFANVLNSFFFFFLVRMHLIPLNFLSSVSQFFGSLLLLLRLKSIYPCLLSLGFLLLLLFWKSYIQLWYESKEQSIKIMIQCSIDECTQGILQLQNFLCFWLLHKVKLPHSVVL